MKHILLICGLFVSQSVLTAAEISVGSTRLSIPIPEGYALITSDMQPYENASKQFVPPMNVQFVQFLSLADAAAAARGETPQSERRFYIQTAKTLVDRFVSTDEFSELKSMVRTQNEEILKKAEAQMPGLFEKVNKDLSENQNLDLNLSLDQMVPLPPHYEAERGFAYSMILRYKVNDENGKPSVIEGVVTATFVHLQGKVLFLYVNAEKAALDWSRNVSQNWADSIIAANPSTGEIAVRENKPSRSGFDWSKVLAKAATGAIIGGIVGAFAYLFRKKKD